MYKLSDKELIELKRECEDKLYTNPLVAQILSDTLKEIEARCQLYL